MGHMKQFFGAFAVISIGFLSLVGSVAAHEGSVDLTSSKVSCKGVSLYQDGAYRVSGRCDGLVYPYETLYNKYVLWGKTDRGEMVRIAQIEKGYFAGNIANPFSSMFITAEKDGLVRKPSDKQVLSGQVSFFNFDKSQVTTAATTPTTATTNANKTTTVQNSGTATVSSTAGAVVGKIVTSLLVIILVVVGLVIGASLIFRSRNSVSA